MKKINIFIIGFGNLGKMIGKYSMNKNYNIVGAADINKNIIFKDIGLLLNQTPLNIYVQDISNLKESLIQTTPDICIISTSGLLKDLSDLIITCISLGINVLTNCEEAFYPQISSISLYEKINKLAIENNCTVSASGYQDIYWTRLVMDLIASCNELKEITGKSVYYITQNNASVLSSHGIGLTIDEFNNTIGKQNYTISSLPKNTIESKDFFPSFMWTIHGWLCSKLGLTLTYQSQEYIPIISKNKFYIENVAFKQNTVCGLNVITTTHTKEKVNINTCCTGKVSNQNDFSSESTQWQIIGAPSCSLNIPSPASLQLTCSSIVNRIPDILSAPPGYLTTDMLPELKYQQ